MATRVSLLVLAAPLLLTGCASVLASSAAPGCIGAPVSLPILSSAGAVIVPIEIDGVAAAAEITPRSSATYLTSSEGFHLPRYEDVRIGGLVGSGIGYRTRLHVVRLGRAEIDGLYVTVHEEPARPLIDGRRIVMTIGSDLLRHDLVLMDLPRRRLVVSCAGSSDPLGGAAVSTPLGDGDAGQIDVVDALVDDRPVSMEINLSSNDTIISQSTAGALGLSDAVLARDPSVRTGSSTGHLGWLHRFRSLRIGGYAAARPRIAILPDITYDVLGLDFFQNKVALFDFADHRLSFRETGGGAAVRSSVFSGVITRNASTTITETSSPQ